MQAWLQKFMTACHGAVADADPEVLEAVPTPNTLVIARRMKGSAEMKRVTSAYVIVLEPPTYTPFQRTSSTFFAAFVLYGSSCKE